MQSVWSTAPRGEEVKRQMTKQDRTSADGLGQDMEVAGFKSVTLPTQIKNPKIKNSKSAGAFSVSQLPREGGTFPYMVLDSAS